MKIVNLDQKSDAWLNWRQNGITATDSVVIQNKSPYKTRWRLWAEKTGKVAPDDLSKNPNVIRGVENEDKARQHYESLHDDMLLPVCAEYEANPLFKASFDGISKDGFPVELKCPSSSVISEVLEKGEASEAYQLYWWQVQHQIMVAGADHGKLCFYQLPDGDAPPQWVEFDVLRDDQAIESILQDGQNFWAMIEAKKPPPKDPERDEYAPEDFTAITAWKESATQWLEQHRRMKYLEDEIKTLKQTMGKEQEALIKLMGEFVRANAFGVQLTRFQVQGAIDWSRVRQDLLPNVADEQLDAYRKKPRQQVRITPSSELSEKAAKAEVKAAKAEAEKAEQSEGEGKFAW
ncbi:YqaJ viral recombinase family protein [Acidihalobacter ferrooxydans]|uniref:YqaJ viral recombinase domain-containing protein n=1 Tax=Acidihalobacter ferrooxydans TaxID=1765967 RepID=A0A1P8UF81_9GAMM|nr:YqaJ viral recombinase family protein [Acidihalobacter ferrooxydans]APZ42513.1 hypothetical protein BW247_04920 [Acidihalobacter ferrooxydans]